MYLDRPGVCEKIANTVGNGYPVMNVQIKSAMKGRIEMEKWRCTVCDYVYDPAVGDPDAGIPPNTSFESLPEDWQCPVCGVGKDEFEKAA